MRVFFLRHGTRNFTMGDVPLNETGREEANELALDPKLQQANTIICSPKKRAQMTIAPLSAKRGIPIKTLESLDQMQKVESEQAFQERVGHVLTQIEDKKFSEPLVVCSHSDWLSVATHLLATDELHLQHHIFQCAEYLEFEIVDGIWRLQ